MQNEKQFFPKGSLVQICFTGLKPEERTANLPEDTRRVPLEIRVKGFLKDESACIGQEVSVETVTGREVTGKMIAVNPKYEHNFGEPVPELILAVNKLQKIMKGDFDD